MNPTRPSDDRNPASEQDAMRIHRQLLGDLKPEEFEQLQRDMIASPTLRQRFMRAVRMDAALREQNFGSPETQIPVPPAKRKWYEFTRTITSIAAVLAITTVVVWRSRPAQPQVVALDGELATLVDSRDCTWASGQSPTVEKRFSAGLLELTSGVAVIEFDGGARLALQGPSKLELIGPKVARLHRGNASVRCEEGLYSFSLLTPTSTVVDLGTEFGVAVDAEGASEVHVLDGEVEVVDSLTKFEPGVRFLNAGQTLTLASNGSEKFIKDTTKSWIRDYSTPLDREKKALPPKVIARDVFATDYTQQRRFALGTGWKGAWWQATEIKPGDLRFVPMAPLTKRDGKSGLALLVGGWVEVRRVLLEPIDPVNTGSVYVSFSLTRMNPESRDEKGKLSDATFLLRSSKDPTAVLGLGLSPLNYWVVAERGGWERSDKPEANGGPFFVVAKIEFSALHGNKVSIAAFDSSEEVPSQEPEKWDMVTQRQHSKMTQPLDTIALRVRHSPFKFGEVALGNSWQAVVNPVSGPD